MVTREPSSENYVKNGQPNFRQFTQQEMVNLSEVVILALGREE